MTLGPFFRPEAILRHALVLLSAGTWLKTQVRRAEGQRLKSYDKARQGSSEAGTANGCTAGKEHWATVARSVVAEAALRNVPKGRMALSQGAKFGQLYECRLPENKCARRAISLTAPMLGVHFEVS